MEFPRMAKKNNVEFPGVFLFGLAISKESHTTLWNIQGLNFVLSGISRGKVRNKKFEGVFKKVYPQRPCLDFFWKIAYFICLLPVEHHVNSCFLHIQKLNNSPSICCYCLPFLKKATLTEEFILGKAEKSYWQQDILNTFGQFISTSWKLLLPSKRAQKNYHFAMVIIY